MHTFVDTMIEKKELKSRIEKKDNRFVIRLKQHEWAILSKLSDKWQIHSFSGVMHRLISISEHLIEKYEEQIAEKEALIRKYQV